jgi:hypothetical protein
LAKIQAEQTSQNNLISIPEEDGSAIDDDLNSLDLKKTFPDVK